MFHGSYENNSRTLGGVGSETALGQILIVRIRARPGPRPSRSPAAPATDPSLSPCPSLRPRCAALCLVPSQRIGAGAWSCQGASLGPFG
ncbi:hypothetical protein PhaeoP36_03924 (plasmid) [Phaeobacter piscinae]|uniref:Uncharacterized protein n=1 Tax=Phaeobacter piscinae TaxID=1580596 RepID=A0ABM6PJR7_9RHOB|nr:hypothetical protein PhaeoP36_03924 [Phaeobacter piscinae]AUQ88521.1 hypothetical protein PhaeoP42_03925 [Phaeobacter piscinae]